MSVPAEKKTVKKTATTKKTTTKAKVQAVASVAAQENFKRGILFALAAPIPGIALWVLLWNWGFMASIVAFAIAWLTVKLYTIGARAEVSRKAIPYVIGIAIVGTILAFMGGYVSDGLEYYAAELKVSESSALFTADFWDFVSANLTNGELWASYRTDILIAIAFAALGMYGTIKDLFVDSLTAPAKK
jgi:hypothetical protein